MEMIKAAGLKKYYVTDNYEVHALDGVSLSVEEGEFLAIIGTSGSGKTTLLQILGGLDEPTAGGVWIRGNSLKDMTEDERTIFRRRNIGFVFQQYNLIPVINVYENIVLPLRLDGAEIDEKLLEDGINAIGVAINVGGWNYVRGHIVLDKDLNFTVDIHNSFEYNHKFLLCLAYLPVEPNPPSPLTVSFTSSTSTKVQL